MNEFRITYYWVRNNEFKILIFDKYIEAVECLIKMLQVNERTRLYYGIKYDFEFDNIKYRR